MIGIYKITNKINGKCYIGQSVNIQQRFNRHRTAPFNPNNRSKNSPLYQAIRKYGLENFTFEILCECQKEDLNEKEKSYIRTYKSHNKKYGYNQTDGGDNVGDICKKLSTLKALSIINELKTNRPIISIAKQHDIGMTLVYQINRGELYPQENTTYPIRAPYQITKTPKKLSRFCPKCGKPISRHATVCSICAKCTIAKEQRPDKSTLAQRIADVGFEAVGREFGVSGNAIKKWCVEYELPKKKKEVVVWAQQQKAIT